MMDEILARAELSFQFDREVTKVFLDCSVLEDSKIPSLAVIESHSSRNMMSC